MDSTRFQRRRLGLALAGALAWGALTSAQAKPARDTRLLVVGDSLSAEYGLARGTGWVALLQRQWPAGSAVTVVNASVSGETTSGGRARLPALLAQHQPTHVVVELGANDALRGLPVAATRDNLSQMVQAIGRQGARAMLLGMQLPPNFGPRYSREFSAVFAEVARENRVPLVPFMLAGVADRADSREWFQADGIHPLAKAHPIVLQNIWTVMEPWLKR